MERAKLSSERMWKPGMLLNKHSSLVEGIVEQSWGKIEFLSSLDILRNTLSYYPCKCCTHEVPLDMLALHSHLMNRSCYLHQLKMVQEQQVYVFCLGWPAFFNFLLTGNGAIFIVGIPTRQRVFPFLRYLEHSPYCCISTSI